MIIANRATVKQPIAIPKFVVEELLELERLIGEEVYVEVDSSILHVRVRRHRYLVQLQPGHHSIHRDGQNCTLFAYPGKTSYRNQALSSMSEAIVRDLWKVGSL